MSIAKNCCINCKHGAEPIDSGRCAECEVDVVQWSNWESDAPSKKKRRYVIENHKGELWCTAAAYEEPPTQLGARVIGVLESIEGDDD